MNLSFPVEGSPSHSPLRTSCLAGCVDEYSAHQRQVDHESVVADGASGDIVPTAPDCNPELVLPRETDGVLDICCPHTSGDQRRPLVDRAVMNLSSFVVSSVTRKDKATGEPRRQLL